MPTLELLFLDPPKAQLGEGWNRLLGHDSRGQNKLHVSVAVLFCAGVGSSISEPLFWAPANERIVGRISRQRSSHVSDILYDPGMFTPLGFSIRTELRKFDDTCRQAVPSLGFPRAPGKEVVVQSRKSRY